VAGGLLDEALLLLRLGMTSGSHVATRAIGYRQACAFLQVKTSTQCTCTALTAQHKRHVFVLLLHGLFVLCVYVCQCQCASSCATCVCTACVPPVYHLCTACVPSVCITQEALARGDASPQQLQQLVLDISTASRNLVKSQLTWFRDEQMFR
jgi:hypothetical protein